MGAFKTLAIGDRFIFASEEDPRFQFSGMAKGPWIKTSTRKYRHADDRMHAYYGRECRIGSINVDTIKG